MNGFTRSNGATVNFFGNHVLRCPVAPCRSVTSAISVASIEHRSMKRSLRSWLWRVPLDQEVDEELALHIEMRTRELVERGMDPKAAREIVLARIGDLGQLKRTCVDLGRKREREMRMTRWIEELRDDVTFALRQLRRSPGFTLVAAITLALGIGANSAMFALADATLLRPFPFPEPDRLVMVSEKFRAFLRTGVASAQLPRLARSEPDLPVNGCRVHLPPPDSRP